MMFQDITSQLAPLDMDKLVEDKLLPPQYPFASIFSKYVFKDKAPDVTKYPLDELFDFKIREIIINNDKKYTAKQISENLRLFSWVDYPSKKAAYPRYFFVWVSPLLDYLIKTDHKRDIPILTFFHPIGEIATNEQKYYKTNGTIDEYYLKVGVRYLTYEHFLLFQTRYPVTTDDNLKNAYTGKAVCLVFPVFSGTAHTAFPHYDSIHYMDIMEGLVADALPQFYPINARPLLKFTLARVAVSAFSIGGSLLNRLFDNLKDEKLTKVKEIYGYDLIIDEKKKQSSYETFWKHLKEWQGDDRTKLIRLYSAESQTVSSIVDELKGNLKKYGGGKLIEARFKDYDNKKVTQYDFNKKKNVEVLYRFSENALEIHSTDNSRVVVLLPMSVFGSYGYGVVNPNGIYLWEGHPWFVNALMTHSLCNSLF
jgi:hypothetical protein